MCQLLSRLRLCSYLISAICNPVDSNRLIFRRSLCSLACGVILVQRFFGACQPCIDTANHSRGHAFPWEFSNPFSFSLSSPNLQLSTSFSWTFVAFLLSNIWDRYSENPPSRIGTKFALGLGHLHLMQRHSLNEKSIRPLHSADDKASPPAVSCHPTGKNGQLQTFMWSHHAPPPPPPPKGGCGFVRCNGQTTWVVRRCCILVPQHPSASGPPGTGSLPMHD